MMAFSFWRVGLALLVTVAAFLLSRPVIEVLLHTIRSRLDKHVLWIADVQRYMLTYIWWTVFLILVRDVVARSILDLGSEEDEVLQYLGYLLAIPLALGTFAMRKVMTNLKNVAMGLFLIFAEPFRTGSEVKVRQMLGFIDRVSLARTTIRRTDGSMIFVPNGIFADNYQTSGNALEAHTHSIMLRLHPATPAHKITELLHELEAVLPTFALTAQAVAALRRDHREAYTIHSRSASSFSASAGSDDSVLRDQCQSNASSNANAGISRTRLRSSANSSAFDATGRPISPPPPPVRVELYAMYKMKVTVLMDRERFSTLEKAKTEVNLAIIDTTQRLGVIAQQQITDCR
ncbi:hypothetical protein KXD40_003872 [Peronospora effusa]|uniref:Mechanosensitive ion channel MscS domain-containing protein n=1 Tax=Peronospora effusa TaxID=542832 RepID=A0A3M6VNY7_9STRA|nr:hypothetical protein DD238_002957 [Peronospora effusa]UIZ23115.1 hypothetical protein KXD40_003872 [Peronospora effusa]